MAAARVAAGVTSPTCQKQKCEPPVNDTATHRCTECPRRRGGAGHRASASGSDTIYDPTTFVEWPVSPDVVLWSVLQYPRHSGCRLAAVTPSRGQATPRPAAPTPPLERRPPVATDGGLSLRRSCRDASAVLRSARQRADRASARTMHPYQPSRAGLHGRFAWTLFGPRRSPFRESSLFDHGVIRAVPAGRLLEEED